MREQNNIFHMTYHIFQAPSAFFVITYKGLSLFKILLTLSLPSGHLKSWGFPFGVEFNSSVFVPGWGTGAVWIKWKNSCSTPKCWIWVTYCSEYLFHLTASWEGEEKKACHLKASILINKQSLSLFTKLLSYSPLCFHCGVRAKQMMGGYGGPREGRVTKPIRSSTNSQISTQWEEWTWINHFECFWLINPSLMSN